MSATQTIFSKTYSRSSVWNQVMLYLSQRKLAKSARLHLSSRRRQLAIFAYDDVSLQINAHGVYERQELETFFAWISAVRPDVFRGATALDLGANIGNHSLFFSDHFNEVHAFEPNARTFKVLSLNAELVDNVRCHNVGLSDFTATAHFRINPSNLGASSVVASPEPGTVEVKLVSLDSAVSGLADIKLIKVDVEGHDHAALVGAKETIAIHKPVILFEQLAEDTASGESATVTLLKTYGYRKFAVMRRRPRAYRWLPAPLRAVFGLFARLLFGETMTIEACDSPPEGYQAMAIAIPDWV
jgi:FkbM family methyltransferase